MRLQSEHACKAVCTMSVSHEVPNKVTAVTIMRWVTYKADRCMRRRGRQEDFLRRLNSRRKDSFSRTQGPAAIVQIPFG